MGTIYGEPLAPFFYGIKRMNKRLIEQMVREELAEMLAEERAGDVLANLVGSAKKDAPEAKGKPDPTDVKSLLKTLEKAPGFAQRVDKIDNLPEFKKVISTLLQMFIKKQSNPKQAAASVKQISTDLIKKS